MRGRDGQPVFTYPHTAKIRAKNTCAAALTALPPPLAPLRVKTAYNSKIEFP